MRINQKKTGEEQKTSEEETTQTTQRPTEADFVHTTYCIWERGGHVHGRNQAYGLQVENPLMHPARSVENGNG